MRRQEVVTDSEGDNDWENILKETRTREIQETTGKSGG
jgi:hypothetical protein